MNGKFEPSENTDQQCEHCGLWFSDRGIRAHEMHCFLAGRDERIVADQTGGGPPEDAPDQNAPPSPEGVGDTPSPERVTDGGETGLGLEGPPETPADDSGGTFEEVDIDDQGGVDEDCCPQCDSDLENIDAGMTFILEDGRKVRVDEGDDWCPECEGIVEPDGGVLV